MRAGTMAAVAAASYIAARDAEMRAEEAARNADLTQDRWDEEHLFPLMTPEQIRLHVTERTRLRERREDIRRQERQHQELLAAERAKTEAIRNRGGGRGAAALLGLAIGLGLD